MKKKHPRKAKLVQLVPKPLDHSKALECIYQALVLLEQELANQIDLHCQEMK